MNVDHRNPDLIRRNSVLMAPNVHPSESTEDAIAMLDSRIPLTAKERRLIVESLWHVAFREGAKQGRLAGIEAAQAEYPDPGTVLREHLTEKARIRDGLTPHPMTDQFLAPGQAHG
jgi:hypothetical protein